MRDDLEVVYRAEMAGDKWSLERFSVEEYAAVAGDIRVLAGGLDTIDGLVATGCTLYIDLGLLETTRESADGNRLRPRETFDWTADEAREGGRDRWVNFDLVSQILPSCSSPS